MSTARAEPPRIVAAAKLPYGQLSRAAPVAVVGCVLSGLVAGAFYALVPAWMQGEGIERSTIALFMLVAVLGGLAFQIPVGRLSDRFDRRIVLAALGVGFAPSPSRSCCCRIPRRWCCPPPACSAVSCRPFTPSAWPMRTTGCRPTGSWR